MNDYHVITRMLAECEECLEIIILDNPEEVFIGGECQCGYYVTRYQPGMEPI